MKITEAQFNTAQKAFSERSLSGAQKEAMVKYIYAKANGAPSRPTVSPLSGYFFLYHKRMLSGFAMLLLLVTGTSYASASSLPGDALYAVKVRVLEPIALAVTSSESSKNEYRITLLQKRIDELQTLKKKTVVSAASQESSAEATSRTVIDLERNSEHDGTVDIARVAEKVRSYNSLVDEGPGITTALSVATASTTDTKDVENSRNASSTPEESHETEGSEESHEDSEPSSTKDARDEVPAVQTLKGLFGL